MNQRALFGAVLLSVGVSATAAAQAASSTNPHVYEPYLYRSTGQTPAAATPRTYTAPVYTAPVYTPPTGLAPARMTVTPPIIVGQDGRYLGRLDSNPYAPDSTSNPYGRYGSKYSPDSVNNPYGQYGSRYSPLSATNPYTTQAPLLIAPDTGNTLGRLSVNPYTPDSTANPYSPAGSRYSPSSVNNPYLPYYTPVTPTRRIP